MLRLDIVKLFRREDAGTIEPLCHVAADTWNVFHRDGEQRRRKVFRPPDRQPVTISAAIALASLARNFRELPVGCKPDRASDPWSGIFGNCRFDLRR